MSFILPFIVLIVVVVFIHEYGHYYFAKKYGVGVTDFSIGFGKELFGNKEDQEKLFVTKPLYQRSLIVAGGPIANFVLAIFIFLFIYMFAGKDFTPAIIDEVQKDSPAEIAGMKKNDIILEIDNNKVESILDVSKLILMSTSEIVDFKVSRYDQELLLKVKPKIVSGVDNLGNKINKRIIGIKLSPYNNEINHKKLGPAKALIESIKEVYFVTTISGQVAEFGILPFISMMAYISISLGLINLFPIPLLDGGHLMFYAFEKVLGKPLSQKTQEGFFRIGMFLLLTLMFFATFNDLKDLGLF